MNIKKIKINELQNAWYNPRKDLTEKDDEYQKLKRSIKEFGYVEPIILNSKNNRIIGGHQRIKVLEDLGYKEVDCVIVELEETREKALNIALNKISGDWDINKLKDLLQEIDTGEIDLELTGFSEEEIEKMMIIEEDEIKPEVEFTEELLEEHNYIVLYFDNAVDWLQAETLFDLKTVKALHSKEGFECKGVGRVLNGNKVLNKLIGGKQ